MPDLSALKVSGSDHIYMFMSYAGIYYDISNICTVSRGL